MNRHIKGRGAGHGNERERLELLRAHRADVVAKSIELQHNLDLVDRKIGIYSGRLDARRHPGANGMPLLLDG